MRSGLLSPTIFLPNSHTPTLFSQCSYKRIAGLYLHVLSTSYVDIGIDIDAKDYCTVGLYSNEHARRTSLCIAKRI